MFQGLRTVIYHVADMERAKAWYTELVGHPPYFAEPFYIGYNVGGYELGLHPLEGAAQTPGQATVVTYWGVEDIEATFARLIALGAVEHSPVTEVGDGIKVADLIDPFGNTIGIIYNPHFKVA